MVKKKQYSEEEIAEANILGALDEEKTKKLNINDIFSIFRFDNRISIPKAISSLKKGNFVEQEENYIKILDKGKKKVLDFNGNCDKKSWKKFIQQEPLLYTIKRRIIALESFIGFLLLSLIFIGLGYLNNYLKILLDLKYNPFFYMIMSIILLLGFFFCFLIWYISALILIIRGVGSILKPISFEVGYYFKANLEDIINNKKFVWILIVFLSIIALIFLGLKGLIGSIIFALVIEICFRRKKIVKLLFNWRKKK